MSSDQLGQWNVVLKNNSTIYRKVKAVLLVLTGITLAALVYLSAILAFELYSKDRELNVRAVTSAKADSRKIDKMARSIERTVRDVSLALGESGLNEKNLIDVLTVQRPNVPCRYSISFVSEADSSAVCGKLSVSGRTRIHDLMGMRVVRKSDAGNGFPDAGLACMKDGWQKASWNKSEKAVILNCQQQLYIPTENGGKRLAGVVSGTISIDDFQKSLDYQNLGQYGYRFVVDGDGLILDHPERTLVVKNFKLLDYARSTYTPENSKNLLNAFKAKSGISIYDKNTINDQKTILRFEPVASTGWFIGLALLVDELTISDTSLKQQLMQLLTVFILFLLLSGLYFILLSSSTDVFLRRVKQYSWIVSCIFIAGLICVWALQITKGAVSPYEDKCITTSSQIEQFKKEQIAKVQLSQSAPPQFIQTGISVNSVSVSDPNETADVYGTMWQRIPAGMDPKQVSGILFPDQIETKLYETYRMEENGYVVIGWNFVTRLQQDLKSSLYPFDRHNIKIRMRQPKKFESIVFVPDIASYKITSPTANPMVPDNFSITGWKINNTYFNFSEQSDNIDYGRRTLMESPIAKDLSLNITIERDWLNSVISLMIPIFIIMVILFSGVYMITHDTNSESFSFDAKEATAIGTAFTMFLVVSIQSVRIQVMALDILYIEKIYFMIYLAMLINVIFVIAITNQTGFLFTYKHGIFYRYLYWPMYSGIFYGITLFSFY
jgi:hypothetical protein